MKKKIYFKNLNALRFLAASMVVVHHIEQFKGFFNIENYFQSIPAIALIGKLGVNLFFVLSGFLITYLLLSEEKFFESIDVKKFYIRRMLRIWPLYFLIVFLSFFVLANIDMFTIPGYNKDFIYDDLGIKLFLYTVLLPNLVLVIYGMIPYASHLWSIGTEEQFYLLWPLLLKTYKKNRLILMVAVILIYILAGVFLKLPISDFLPHKEIIASFRSTFTVSCMAIGGIYAVLLFNKSKVLKIINNKFVFYFVLILVTSMIFLGIYIPFVQSEFYGVFFGLIILNFSSNENIGFSLENKHLNHLGNISYGMYMYHPIAIMLAIYTGSQLGITSNWLFYPLSFLFTILMADISYKYFESYFLKFKTKFAKIVK